MTPLQFVGQNIHFTIDLLAALACFAGGWLYFDAWTGRKRLPSLLKWLGFFLLSMAFLADSITSGNPGILTLIGLILKLIGYGSLIVGDIVDPLQKRPEHQTAKNPAPDPTTPPAPTTTFHPTKTVGSIIAPVTTPAPTITPTPTPALPSRQQQTGFIATTVTTLTALIPLGALGVAILYWRRCTKGLERHLKPLAWTFLVFAIADLLALAGLFAGTDNPLLQPILGTFGPFWIAHHVALLSATVILTIWVWHYLTKRLLTQIFVMSTSLTVGIVLLATMSVAFLLYRNLVSSALANLETAARVLDYAITSQSTEVRAATTTITQNPAVQTAITNNDHKTLTDLTVNLANTNRHLSDIIITEADGGVLARASDPERYGDSLSEDSGVRRALLGTVSTGLVSKSGALSPTLLVTSTAPIRANSASTSPIIGSVTTMLALDNSFVDGIKHATNLDSAVYAGNTRAATTITGPDGISRAVGAKEASTTITKATLTNGQTWRGSLTISNIPYLGTYLPLKDADDAVIGMLFVGQPQSILLTAAQSAVRLTFTAAAIWLILIIAPIYFTSRKIAKQLH